MPSLAFVPSLGLAYSSFLSPRCSASPRHTRRKLSLHRSSTYFFLLSRSQNSSNSLILSSSVTSSLSLWCHWAPTTPSENDSVFPWRPSRTLGTPLSLPGTFVGPVYGTRFQTQVRIQVLHLSFMNYLSHHVLTNYSIYVNRSYFECHLVVFESHLVVFECYIPYHYFWNYLRTSLVSNSRPRICCQLTPTLYHCATED